jgi:anti-sigma factor RsiW
MNCQGIDVKAYSFGEVPVNERREAELHLKGCAECREELARLQFVQAALGGLREEEPPRRIAFVSDKVFEPNWWQRFWAAGPRVGFAGASLLSTAILVHAFTRPAVIHQSAPAPASVAAQVSDRDIQNRIDTAVEKAVAQVEAKQKADVQQLLAATEKKYELDRKALEMIADENSLLRRQYSHMLVQTAGLVKQ